MIHALLLFGVFIGCLWISYLCLRHVFRAATAQHPPSAAAPPPDDPSAKPVRR